MFNSFTNKMSERTSSIFINSLLYVDENTSIGVNGSDVYTAKGLGDNLLSLYNTLNGFVTNENIKLNTKLAISDKSKTNITELFVLLFQTRDIKNGKGLRTLSYDLFFELYDNVNSKICLELLHLFPFYGYYKDLVNIYNICNDSKKDSYKPIKNKILYIFSDQIKSDMKNMISDPKNVSLLSKWLPRESSNINKILYKDLVKFLVSINYINTNSNPKKEYRKIISILNKHIDTVEIKMCSNNWQHIDPSHIPGICLNKFRKAFLNEKIDSSEQRYNRLDRIKCSDNLKLLMKNKPNKLNGSHTILPHVLVNKMRKILYNKNNDSEVLLLNSQWNNIKNSFKNSFLKKCIPMCDLSGSMKTILSDKSNCCLMDISIALSILVSELNEKSFKDIILSFSETCKIINLSNKNNLSDKINHIFNDMSNIGLNTNFESAYNKILDTLVLNKVPVGEEPEMLIVFTDMGFDSCDKKSKNFSTVCETLKEKFNSKCIEVHGSIEKSWKLPKIVIWNLSSFNEFQSKSNNTDIVTISGWSKNNIELLNEEEFMLYDSSQILKKILSHDRYNIIREIVEKTI